MPRRPKSAYGWNTGADVIYNESVGGAKLYHPGVSPAITTANMPPIAAVPAPANAISAASGAIAVPD
jgi:hypothetical protein